MHVADVTSLTAQLFPSGASVEDCDKQGANCSTHRQTVCVWASVLDDSCLLCSNVQMCTRSSQVRIRFELYSPTFPVCVTTVEVRDANGVPCVQNATCFSCRAARLGVRFSATTGSRVLDLSVEQQKKTSQAVVTATGQQQICYSTLSRLRNDV